MTASGSAPPSGRSTSAMLSRIDGSSFVSGQKNARALAACRPHGVENRRRPHRLAPREVRDVKPRAGVAILDRIAGHAMLARRDTGDERRVRRMRQRRKHRLTAFGGHSGRGQGPEIRQVQRRVVEVIRRESIERDQDDVGGPPSSGVPRPERRKAPLPRRRSRANASSEPPVEAHPEIPRVDLVLRAERRSSGVATAPLVVQVAHFEERAQAAPHRGAQLRSRRPDRCRHSCLGPRPVRPNRATDC